MDKDGDGQVSLDEMRLGEMDDTLEPRRAYLKAKMDKAHKSIDKDGDGKITFDEVMLAFQSAFVGGDRS